MSAVRKPHGKVIVVEGDTERDFGAEMRALVTAETADGAPYVSALVAERIVEKLRATDPDLLAGWLQAGAVGFLRQQINLRDGAHRMAARHAASRSVFRNAADAAEAGDYSGVSHWLDIRYVVEDGSRTRLADLTAGDLSFVASAYETRAAENALEGAFLRALARKVGDGRVSDHFSEEQIRTMRESLVGV